MKYTGLFFTILLLFIRCSNPNNQSVYDEIDLGFYEDIIEEKKNLSEYADSVRFVKLNTFGKVVLSGDLKIVFGANRMVINDQGTEKYLLFNDQGEFLKELGSMGKGPEEFLDNTDVFIDPNHQQVLLLDRPGNKILVFDTDGNFEKVIKIGYWMDYICVLDKDRILLFCTPETKAGHMINENKPNILIIDRNGKEIVKKNVFIDYELDQNYFYFSNLYALGNEWRVYPQTAVDTIYGFDHDFNLVPKSVFVYKDKVDKKSPAFDAKNTLTGFYFKGVNFFGSPIEFNSFIFFPVSTKLDGKKATLLYDKTEKKTYNQLLDRSLSWDGIYDDMDFGPTFWPFGAINENTAYQILSSNGLLALKQKRTQDPNLPDLSRNLNEILKDMKEFDDPIIRIVYFKK